MKKNIPQILRKVRLDKGFSQENVAEELHVNATTYGRYEKGETEIGFEQVVALAKLYKLSLEEFYHYDDPEFYVKSAQKKRSSISVVVELDGLQETLDLSIRRLIAINQAL